MKAVEHSPKITIDRTIAGLVIIKCLPRRLWGQIIKDMEKGWNDQACREEVQTYISFYKAGVKGRII